MLIDFRAEGKTVLVVGGGAEGYRKTKDFVEAGFTVHVVSEEFSDGIQKLAKQGKIGVKESRVETPETFFANLESKPDLFVAVTDDAELNARLIKHAKAEGCMVYSPDNPTTSDFTLPAVAKIGEVRIAVSTSGSSPAMASVLRKRIEKLITQEDLLQIKLQKHVRKLLKRKVLDQKVRKELLYAIMDDVEVQELLGQGKFEEAKAKAEALTNLHLDS
ncbi:MAG: bifunctional precorrin-2 dehydrogenase/sirohydrochlorin ferrochelatase [Candidatus Bathyarchaeota archaeon]|nr:bifunctional precorrin-2 dehydrogenase/sirohydrochlorin ferrochelatase [Candidatus Bathyarchaeota archaeon]